MNDLISREAVLKLFATHDGDYLYEAIRDMPSAQPERTSNNDCNGCKFVGCYDTDFPCANCIRKNKDYYAPERRTDG